MDGCGFRPERFRFHQKHRSTIASVLPQPANLSNTIQYAVTAASHGDIESAISAYEQLRFYNPKLAATRFQLGVLYYQLGYAQARGYLQTALAMPDLTPEFRQKIEDLLEIVDKKLQPDQFYGFAQTGLSYQTNASLSAGAQTVLASERPSTAISSRSRTGTGLARSG